MSRETQKLANRWRIFCAINLPQIISERLMQHITAMRQTVPHNHVSWARESNIHLTIKFLGEILESSVERVSLAASRAIAGITPFNIEVGGTGAFPKRGPPKVLWIGVGDLCGQLEQLHKQLERECARAGFPKDERPFHPHLTVARLRRPQGARTLATTHQKLSFAPVIVKVSELHVIRSELNSEGSKYTVLSRHELEGRSALSSS